jgi:two-component system chemotaxis response regulator CheB
MSVRPTPVIICSSLAKKGCELSVKALSLGAVDIITKPQLSLKGFLQEAKQRFWQVIRNASTANVKVKITLPQQLRAPEHKPAVVLTELSATTDIFVAIGTSTGGTIALEYIVRSLPRTTPGIVVVQHMPEMFTSAFAKRLNDISDIDVMEAESGLRIIPGRILIAPGGHHMEVLRSGAQYVVRVFRGPPVNRHCPSVDVLFRSVAKAAGRNAVGIIMTGMGDDGAQGLLAMKNAGAYTIAQDEASSVVFGMPKEAIKLNAALTVCNLNNIPSEVMSKAG